MFRTFVLPALLMASVGGPLLYVHHQGQIAQVSNDPAAKVAQATQMQWQSASFPTRPSSASELSQPAAGHAAWSNESTFSNSLPASENGAISNSSTPSNFQAYGNVAENGGQSPAGHLRDFSSAGSFETSFASGAWNQAGLTPDFAKAETLVFPGDVNGPDLTATPMSFVPTTDLSTLFRFDISKNWVTSRWDRISTLPAFDGLHGMRVALVTGTNSWDLHGALTYYFDSSHRLQRITYRGWTGDANRLVQILQHQHGLSAHPTHWAGLYLSTRSGLMMKHPAVIDKSNPVEQLGLVLEINNPRGNSPLSADFQSLLPAAMATR